MLIRGLWICSLFCILVLLCLLALFCWIFAKAIFLRFVLGALGSVRNRKGESDRIFGWHFLCIFYLFRDGSWFVAFIVIGRCEFDGLFECNLVKCICCIQNQWVLLITIRDWAWTTFSFFFPYQNITLNLILINSDYIK